MIREPEPLNVRHDVSSFSCGEPSLDQWLRRRAMTNQTTGASRTYVIAEDEGRVIGYYSLATGAINQTVATGKVKRNMPNPVPVMLLGRLAIAISHQGRGLGMALLGDAILRTQQVAEIAGCRALLVHALHEKAARFYQNAGFQVSPTEPLMYMLLLDN